MPLQRVFHEEGGVGSITAVAVCLTATRSYIFEEMHVRLRHMALCSVQSGAKCESSVRLHMDLSVCVCVFQSYWAAGGAANPWSEWKHSHHTQVSFVFYLFKETGHPKSNVHTVFLPPPVVLSLHYNCGVICSVLKKSAVEMSAFSST